MIEELKELVALVNSLPQLALWVAIGFWAYKVIIVGSIYGVIRMVVQKVHDVLTRPKSEDINVSVDGVVHYAGKAKLVTELRRVLPDKYSDGTEALEWLSDAITAKIEKDGLPKKRSRP